MAVTLQDLTTMSQTELDDLFRRAPLGEIPDGDAERHGHRRARHRARRTHPALGALARLAGQGRLPAAGLSVQQGRPTRLAPGQGARVRRAELVRRQPAIILDYSKTSLIAHKVRDEIREVSPGTFLGIVYFGTRKTINFVLQFNS